MELASVLPQVVQDIFLKPGQIIKEDFIKGEMHATEMLMAIMHVAAAVLGNYAAYQAGWTLIPVCLVGVVVSTPALMIALGSKAAYLGIALIIDSISKCVFEMALFGVASLAASWIILDCYRLIDGGVADRVIMDKVIANYAKPVAYRMKLLLSDV